MWLRKYYQAFFQKIKIEHISGSIIQSFIHFVFIVCQNWRSSKGIETKLQTTCLYPYKDLWKK